MQEAPSSQYTLHLFAVSSCSCAACSSSLPHAAFLLIHQSVSKSHMRLVKLDKTLCDCLLSLAFLSILRFFGCIYSAVSSFCVQGFLLSVFSCRYFRHFPIFDSVIVIQIFKLVTFLLNFHNFGRTEQFLALNHLLERVGENNWLLCLNFVDYGKGFNNVELNAMQKERTNANCVKRKTEMKQAASINSRTRREQDERDDHDPCVEGLL